MATFNYVNPEVMEYGIFGAPSGNVDAIIESSRRNFLASVGDQSQKFFESTQRLSTKWHGSEAIRLGRIAVAKIDNVLFQRDEIAYLNTHAKIQTAQPQMQRWITSEPSVARLHKRGRVQAYGREYDAQAVEDDNIHLNDGRFMFDEDDNVTYTQVLYVEGDENQLSYVNQETIWDTHEVVREAILANVDITSIMGGSID